MPAKEKLKFSVITRLFLAVTFVVLSMALGAAYGNGTGEIPANSSPLPMEPIVIEQDSGLDAPSRLVIRDQEKWTRIWEEITRNRVSANAAPSVDFDRFMIVLAAMGTHSTGGHSIHIEGTYRSDEHVFIVVRQVFPSSDCMTTQALSSPVVAVRVPKSDLPWLFLERKEVQNCP